MFGESRFSEKNFENWIFWVLNEELGKSCQHKNYSKLSRKLESEKFLSLSKFLKIFHFRLSGNFSPGRKRRSLISKVVFNETIIGTHHTKNQVIRSTLADVLHGLALYGRVSQTMTLKKWITEYDKSSSIIKFLK